MIVEYLENWYRKEAQERLETPNNPFRASAMGHCIRAGCFDLLGLKGKPLQPRRIAVFRHGDIIHETLTKDLEEALGWRFVKGLDLSVLSALNYVEIDGAKISYHIDGAFQYNDKDREPSEMNSPDTSIGIIEIKTMSDFSFNRALKGEIDHEYLCQAWVYFKGTDFNPVVFLAYRKETSAMVEIVFDRTLHEKVVTQTLTGDPLELAKKDPILLTEIKSPFDESVEKYVRDRIKWLEWTKSPGVDAHLVRQMVPGAEAVEDEIVNYNGKKNVPDYIWQKVVNNDFEQSGNWYKFKTGRKILGFPCSYCAHMERCYPTVQMEMKGERPIWVLPQQPSASTAGIFKRP